MIWVIGCKGMLGREVSQALEAKGLEYVGSDREVDITDLSSLGLFAENRSIEWIINCAAYTAVDRAEEEPEAAQALNADGPENIARLSRHIHARMVHISTDYVFDGRAERPYREDDPLGPLGVYGRTKAAGESRVQTELPESFLVRTAWLYGIGGKNFVHTMLKAMAEKDLVRVVADQRGSPTNAADLAAAILTIVTSGKLAFGIYHYVGGGETSWYDFAVAIRDEAREVGAPLGACRIEPIASVHYSTRAERPKYSVLCSDKFHRTFGDDIPHWRDSLRRHIHRIYK